MKLLRYGFAIALPPVGVLLTYGISPTFLISLPLTFLGWLPGIIYAVWAIAKHYEKQNAMQQNAVTVLTDDSLTDQPLTGQPLTEINAA